jgi:hypothetical protein
MNNKQTNKKGDKMRKMISGALIVLALNVSIASPSQAYWVEKWGGIYWCDAWGCR